MGAKGELNLGATVEGLFAAWTKDREALRRAVLYQSPGLKLLPC